MFNTSKMPRKLSIYLLERETRKVQLNAISGLQLTGLILDYELILTEDCDPVAAILDHEYGKSRSSKSEQRMVS
ncbi:MAG: hypothetical protein ACI9G1_000595 [Pirellulaceae bacterium]|jgi:hypothetical protein